MYLAQGVMWGEGVYRFSLDVRNSEENSYFLTVQDGFTRFTIKRQAQLPM